MVDVKNYGCQKFVFVHLANEPSDSKCIACLKFSYSFYNMLQISKTKNISKFYSRFENNKSDIELSTFRKIVEAGLGKKLTLQIK